VSRPDPRRPLLAAALLFALAALSLCWPMLDGQFLAGPNSDQFEAGYSFRHFAAQYFRAHGAIPQWNPYLFAGLPFIGAMHGDVFYPTAWLRWLLPTDVAMNLGFALHLVLAGLTLYGLARALKVSWAGAVVGGLAYELAGSVASLVHPGHDGKLFVSALAPLLLLGILLAVRDRRMIGYAITALATGLSLHGHPQMSYYLLVAGVLWGAMLLFGGEGPATGRERLRVAAAAVGAVALGFGLYAVQALPFYEYIPFSPRAEGASSTGWDYATAFALPLPELLDTVLPQFSGFVTPTYFGSNPLKYHTEYLGPVVLLLATMGLGGDPAHRRVRRALVAIGVLFLLVALGGSTPFYRLWYEVMPMMKKVRAPGMAFFLVALPIAAFAALGADRLLSGAAPRRRIWIGASVLAAIGLLGLVGPLQAVAEGLARDTGVDQRIELAIMNAPALRGGATRLLAAALIGGGAMDLISRGRLAGRRAGALLVVVTALDLGSVVHRLFVFSPDADLTYADDQVMARIKQAPAPYRVWVPGGAFAGYGTAYPPSWLMAAGIPTLLGYHGNELHRFDELLGGKNDWRNQVNPGLLRMFAIRYAVLNRPLEVPGFHPLLGPVPTVPGDSAYLFEADSAPPYAWVVSGAAKLPEDQLLATVTDQRFPVDRLVLYADSASVAPRDLGGQVPEPPAIGAAVAEWRPGRMRVQLEGQAPDTTYLVVAENWYQDWRGRVDGREVPVLRANHTLLSVVLPPGAREVVLEFDSRAYRRGRAVTLVSLAGLLALFVGAGLSRPALDRTGGAKRSA
jgi:hypothetical protein